MRTLIAATALCVTLPLATAAQDASTVMATVNGTDITLGHLIAMGERLPPEYSQIPVEELLPGLIDQAIQQQVLAEVGRERMTDGDRLGLENEERAFLAARVIDRAAQMPLEESDVQAAYDAQFDGKVEWNASHILVESETEARALKAQLDDGADFATLARENSTGPSGPSGGELGWFGTGMMVPAFEEAVTALEPETVSDPVETQFGWHVIRLNETRDAEAPPLEQVRPEIEQTLRRDAITAMIENLVAEAEVERSGAEIDPEMVRDTSLLGE